MSLSKQFFATTIAFACVPALLAADPSPKAKRVMTACESRWDGNKGDCSAFVRAVGHDVGIDLSGTANAIVDAMGKTGSGWTALKDGKEASDKATAGLLVVAGLKAEPHGHVVVVVPGPLAREKYPTAYWGRLGGEGEKKKTINYAWKEKDRDQVQYFAHEIKD
jgi:hypothetical protein